MLKLFTDFSADTVGQAPAQTTLRYQAASTHYLVEDRVDSTGGKVLNVNVGSVISGISWNQVDADADRNNVEVVLRFIAPTGIAGGRMQGLLRGAATAGDGVVDGYSHGINNAIQEKVLTKYDPGPGLTKFGSSAFSAASSTWFMIRARANASDHKVKVWQGTPSDEPLAWDVEVADPYDTAAGVAGLFAFDAANFKVDFVGIATGGQTAPTDPSQVGPSLSIPDPIIPGTTTTFSTSGNVDPWTGARITDSAGSIKEITLASQTSVSAPALGTQSYVLFGDATLEVYNATESATTTVAFNPPASHQYLVTLPAAPDNLTDTGYLHDWAPDDGYEGAQVIATVPIDDQGNILETDVVGEQTFYGIDDFDGAMQGFAVILGKGIIAVNSGNPLVAGEAFTVEILDIHAEDVHYLRLTAGGSAWDLMPASVVSATELTFTAPADLPTGETLTLKLFEDKALRKARELEARIAALEP